MTDKWAEHKQKFCGCKDASRLNRCQGRNNCELPEGHPERASAAPRHPEGEGLGVVAWQDAENPLYTTAERRVLHDWVNNGYPIVELCRLSDAQRAIAELQAERDTMRQQRDKLAAEIMEQCRLNGMGAERELKLIAERAALRQQLAERDAQIASMRAEVTPFIETHWMPVAHQRDKLADLLDEVKSDLSAAMNWGDLDRIAARIDASLAEVNK